MAALHKCPACGFEGDNFPGGLCPQCGKKLVPDLKSAKWIIATIQLALVAGFMLAFHFPRPMIAFFALMIVLSTLLSSRLRDAAATAKAKTPTPPSPQEARVRLVNAGIAAISVAFFMCLMFGFIMFMNSWEAWHRFEGQRFHATTFQVTRTYYQPPRGRAGARAYASGIVDGSKEWMDLFPYLKAMPRSEADLEQRVPIGTTIAVYLFPDLKGSRVQVIASLPPADANHKHAISVLNHELVILAILGGIVFVLVRVRRSLQNPNTLTTAVGA